MAPSVDFVEDDVRLDQAYFYGILLASLAYGALVMLFVQVTQVMLRRPKRGRIFWFTVLYSTILFPLATVAFVGKIKFAEVIYVANRNYSYGPKAYYRTFGWLWPNVMSMISSSILFHIADLLMFYRLMVLWNHRYWLLIIPSFIYLASVGISIPLTIAQSRENIAWASRSFPYAYGTVYFSLCVSLNLIFTILICVRLFTMRQKAEQVLGKLQASFYNSPISMFVESGGFLTVWSLSYLLIRQSGNWVADIFLQPYPYIMALTRMLIILRVAQDRAWSKDIITAAVDGPIDWQVSSPNLGSIENLPEKFRRASISSKGSL